MSYEVLILRRAQKELADLPKADYERIRDAIAALAENPRPAGCKKLVGREGWRMRSGDYRAIYEIDDAQKKVTVLDIGHRRDVYS
ncbi:MAG: type II toxin-antitoxin system RelE/ParE family toxin [Acidobacteria bacterium]|nr:type II toxin-antitoxin system RelE/ParE family toxin [Acidobacteriota bacterium]